jgi:serine/threonine protein kinase
MGQCGTRVTPDDVGWPIHISDLKHSSSKGIPFVSIENDFQSVHNSPITEPAISVENFQMTRIMALTFDQSTQTDVTIAKDAVFGVNSFTNTPMSSSFRQSRRVSISSRSSTEQRRLSFLRSELDSITAQRRHSLRAGILNLEAEEVELSNEKIEEIRAAGYETDSEADVSLSDSDEEENKHSLTMSHATPLSPKRSERELMSERRISIRLIQKNAVSLKTTVSAGRSDDGKKMVNEYVLLRKLGSGTYGKVKLCMHKETGQYLAIKIINRSLLNKVKRDSRGRPMKVNQIGLVLKEVAILKKLYHANVVQLHEVIDDPTDEKLFMIFEYIERGAVMKLSGSNETDRPPFTDGAARKYFRDLISGLEYLHMHKVIHRDIKPENLLVDNNDRLKLTDFGVSHMFDGEDDVLYTSAGTPAFLAPEACTVGQYRGKPSDIWSAGVTLYVMVFGTVPFTGSGILGTYNSILYDEPEFPEIADTRMVDLLQRILTKNPDQRITIDEIKQHPWITDSGKWPFDVATAPVEKNPVTEVTEQEIRDAIVEGRSTKMIDKFVMMSNLSRKMAQKARGARQRVMRRKLLQQSSPSSIRGSRRSLRLEQQLQQLQHVNLIAASHNVDRRSLPSNADVEGHESLIQEK